MGGWAQYSQCRAMQSWDRPPPDVGVAEFFERWLPEAFAKSNRRGPLEGPVVRASISGEGGGAWQLQAHDDELTVEAPGREAPDVWVRQSVNDLRAALGAPDPDLPVLIPPGWSALDLLFLDPRDVELLRQVSGRVALEIDGRRPAAVDRAGRRRHVRRASHGRHPTHAAPPRRPPQDRGRPRPRDAAPPT